MTITSASYCGFAMVGIDARGELWGVECDSVADDTYLCTHGGTGPTTTSDKRNAISNADASILMSERRLMSNGGAKLMQHVAECSKGWWTVWTAHVPFHRLCRDFERSPVEQRGFVKRAGSRFRPTSSGYRNWSDVIVVHRVLASADWD